MFYSRLYEAVEILHHFFYSGGEGLSGEWLENVEYKNIKMNLKLYKVSKDHRGIK